MVQSEYSKCEAATRNIAERDDKIEKLDLIVWELVDEAR